MLSENFHPSDQELLRTADGELPAGRAAQVRAHLTACWDCRARMGEIEGAIADFTRAHHNALDPELPPIDGPRALLRARLTELKTKSRVGPWWRALQFTPGTWAAAYICVAFLFAAFLFQRSRVREANSPFVPFERGAVPSPSLTPGAVSYTHLTLPTILLV